MKSSFPQCVENYYCPTQLAQPDRVNSPSEYPGLAKWHCWFRIREFSETRRSFARAEQPFRPPRSDAFLQQSIQQSEPIVRHLVALYHEVEDHESLLESLRWILCGRRHPGIVQLIGLITSTTACSDSHFHVALLVNLLLFP